MTQPSESSTKLTYADYCAIPEDRCRHEIIEGEHFVTPSSESYHQELVVKLTSRLHALIQESGLGRVYVAPMDVLLSEHDIVQPDVFVILEPNRGIITRPNIKGAPDLVLEILSPSTRSRDRGLKRELYEHAGVGEYWIVDPKARSVAQYRRGDLGYELVGEHSERINLAVAPGLTVDLRSIW